MADWSKPVLTDSYANFLSFLNARLVDCASMFDSGQEPSNLPTGAIRFNPAAHRFERWSGSAWGVLDANDWDMSVARLGGKTAAEFLLSSGGTISGTLGFGARLGQFLNLYGTTFGLGIQTYTTYLRTAKRFAMHVGGTHSDAEGDPGAGGVCLLDATNGLWKFYVGSTDAGFESIYMEKRLTWGNGKNYPVLRGSNDDECLFLHMPHLPYLDSGVAGVSSSKSAASCGAMVRMAANPSASHFWDAGIVKSVGQDTYSICRNYVSLFKIANTGNLQSAGRFESNCTSAPHVVVDHAGSPTTLASYNALMGYDNAFFISNNASFNAEGWKCKGRGTTPGTASYLKINNDGSGSMGTSTGNTANGAITWTNKELWDANGKWVGEGGGNPPGAVIYYAGAAAPAGYLVANGAPVSRTTYAALFSAIGTTYGAGNGSTTFALPDLRGEFIRGLDSGRGVDAGRVLGSFQSDSFKSHSHTLPSNYTEEYSTPQQGIMQNYFQGSSSTNATGGTETRPRNISLLPCIKY